MMKVVGGGEDHKANFRSGGKSRCSVPRAASPNHGYRRIGQGSYVDESLFQGTAKGKKGVMIQQDDARISTTKVAVISKGKP